MGEWVEAYAVELRDLIVEARPGGHVTARALSDERFMRDPNLVAGVPREVDEALVQEEPPLGRVLRGSRKNPW